MGVQVRVMGHPKDGSFCVRLLGCRMRSRLTVKGTLPQHHSLSGSIGGEMLW